MTLYIYRVGWTYPARNSITDLNLQRVLVVLGFQVDRSDRSDRSVLPDRLHGPDRSDRPQAPVRPVCSTSANFDRQQDHCTLCLLTILKIGKLEVCTGPDVPKQVLHFSGYVKFAQAILGCIHGCCSPELFRLPIQNRSSLRVPLLTPGA